MPVNSVSYSRYKPTELVIHSLGIGVSSNTNENLGLSGTQHLVVGETLVGNLKNYGLIVDKQGIAINSTIPNRTAFSNEYALVVEGNMFVRGSITACNYLGGTGVGTGTGGTGGGTDSIWESTELSSIGVNGIYFPGKITVGNLGTFAVASNNAHAVNVVESANSSIDNIQLNINNTQNAILRMGVLGTAEESPAVINTGAGTGLEIHIGRDQAYFEERYAGEEIPSYGTVASNAPHLIFDSVGNVGIHTSIIPPRSYEQSLGVSTTNGVIFPTVSEPMSLDVNGSLMASNILIWDYQAQENVNIDRLYVRRLGLTYNPDQVIPGSFAPGNYIFQDKLSVNGPIDPGYDLTVNGDAIIKNNFRVEGKSELTSVNVFESIMFDVASFCNDIFVHRDAIIRESIRLKGGMFIEVPDGPNAMSWCNIQFTVANADYSNINIYGAGITTPGRMGVGINPGFDEVNNQFVVRKRDRDLFELELYDKGSHDVMHKAAYIGHPLTSEERIADGSLVIATPGAFDPDFSYRIAGPAPQNIYMYPGAYRHGACNYIVGDTTPPVLNAHHTKRVGILTFDPVSTLDVRGSMAISGTIYKIPDGAVAIEASTPNVGFWLEQSYAAVTSAEGSFPAFRGIEYTNSNAPYVGIHTDPDPRYGVTAARGIKSSDGFFTADHRRMGDWIHSAYSSNLNAGDAMRWAPIYTLANVGIGITAPTTATLEIKNPRAGPTKMRLIRGDQTNTTAIEMGSVASPWALSANTDTNRFALDYGGHVSLFSQYNTILGRPQLVAGSNIGVLTSTRNPKQDAVFTVDGHVSVVGDVYASNVHVSGAYYSNGIFMVNENLAQGEAPTLNNDDVFISGKRVIMMPNEGVMIGNRGDSDNDTTIALRVFQSQTNINTLARFSTNSINGLLEVVAGDRTLKFGFLERNNVPSFAFMDKNNIPYLSFNADTTDKYVGFNVATGQTPSASLHVQNSTTGSNMLKLTRFVEGSDISAFAPEIELQKIVNLSTEQQDSSWIIRGPNASFQQKLSFDYVQQNTGSAVTRTEVFSLSSNGCIGLGTPTPEFAIDIVGTGKRGSIRMYNTAEDPLPQLIFQSGPSNAFGADSLTDYRFYSSNNEFVFDMQNDTLYKEILHIDRSAHVGINTLPAAEYALNVGGAINVQEGFFIDGTPLFSERGVNLYADNLYLRPRPLEYGGVVVNYNQPTSNLFYIVSGRDANMLTLDSIYDESQIYFRTRRSDTAPMYFDVGRMGLSNNAFAWSFKANAGGDLYFPATDTGYIKSMVVTTDGISLLEPGTGITIGDSVRMKDTSSGLVIDLYDETAEVKGSLQVNCNVTVHDMTFPFSQVTSEDAVDAVFVVRPTGAGAGTGLGLTMTSNGYVGVNVNSGAPPVVDFQVGNDIFMNSNLGLGTSNPQTPLHVIGLSTFAGSLMPETGITYDLGASNMRWRDLYLSSGSLDIDGTQVSRDGINLGADGALRVHDEATNELRAMVMSQVIFNDINALKIRPSVEADNTNSPLVFTMSNMNGETLTYQPVVKSPVSDGTGFGIETPEAMLHIVAPARTSFPTLILDHLGTSNTHVVEVRVHGSNVTQMDRDGNLTHQKDLNVTNAKLQVTPSFVVDARTAANEYTQGIERVGNVVRFTPSQSLTFANQKVFYYSSNHGGMAGAASLSFVTPQATEQASLGSATDDITITVTVQSVSGTPKFFLNGVQTPEFFVLYTNRKYVFDQSDSTNAGYILRLATDSVNNTEYTTGVTYVGTPGAAGAYTELLTTYATPKDLYYFNPDVDEMGEPGTLKVRTEFRVTVANGKFYIGGVLTPSLVLITGQAYEFNQTNETNIGFPMSFSTVRDAGRFFDTKFEATFSNVVTCLDDVAISGDLDVGGNIRNSGNVITSSDMRLKKDIIRITGALDKLEALNGYTFTKVIGGQDGTRRDTGVVAQEVLAVLPEAVEENPTTGLLSVAYGNMMGLMIEAIKELREEVRALALSK